MRKLIFFFSFVLILVFSLPAFAVDIKGVVIDKQTGDPLPGANVFITGTTFGAATDLYGKFNFSYEATEKFNLTVSFMGYKTETKTLSSSDDLSNVRFELEVDVLRGEEIVVTGTGYELKKRELASPVATINRPEIELAPAQTIDQLIQGRVAGGGVGINTGQPGTGARMQIRGVKSATVSQTPVIYVDGVRVDANDQFRLDQGSGGPVSHALADILVSDIDRVEVIKGGAASTLYGSEGANGVIQIFTQKGKAGVPRWKFRVEQGIDQPDKKFLIEDFTKNEIVSNGAYQKYTVGVDGGTSNLTYHLSGHILGADGVLPKNADSRYSLQAGFRGFPSRKLQIDFSGNLIHHKYERVFSNNAIAGVFTSVEGHYSDFFGSGITDQDRLDLLDEYMTPQLDETINRYTFATTARYDPHPYFSTRLTIGTDYRKSEQRYFIPIAGEVVTSTPGGGLFRADREFMSLTLDYAGTIKYPNTGLITSTFTFGAQGFREEDRETQVNATQFGLPGTDDFDNAANLSPQESNQQIFSGGFFFNEQIGIRDKIFVNLGIRSDGNTAFGDKVTLVSYPKFGIAYNFADEAFWPGGTIGSIVPGLKLRASYGQTGMFPAPFTRDKQFTQGAYLEAVAAGFGNPGDPDLKPEKTTTIEYGFDMALLNQRVALEFSVYNEETTDALFSVPSDPSTGLGFQLRNVGTIENKGIELAVDATILNMRNVKFSLGGSFITIDNEVTSLGGSQPFSIGGFAFLPLRIEEGHPVGVFRTNIPTSDGKYDANQLIHSPQPDKRFSVRADLSLWQNLQLTVIGDGQSGGQVLNTGSVLRFFNGAEPGGAEKVPEGYTFVTASDVFIEDSDFFKIREISLTYAVPRKYFGYFGSRVILNASIRNVLTFCENKYLDPELNGLRANRQLDVGGINMFTLSPSRQFRFSVLFEL